MNVRSLNRRVAGGALAIGLTLGTGLFAIPKAVAQVNEDRSGRDRRRDERDQDRNRDRDRNTGRRTSDREREIALERARGRERERERIARERELERERVLRDRYRYPGRGPIYTPGPVYGPVYGQNRYPYDRGGYSSARSIAEQRGYATGLDRGRDDGRSHRSYNPNNSQHYRDGDSGYHSEYGSKGAYEAAYRDGFRRGYAVGYREFSRGRRF